MSKEISLKAQEINLLNNELMKQKEINTNNYRNEQYASNTTYEDYDEEIIKGESTLDCLNENTVRNTRVLEMYQQQLRNIEYLKKKTMEEMRCQLDIQAKNLKEVKETTNNMNGIVKIEQKKFTQDYEIEIERIKNDYEKFKTELKPFKIEASQKYMMNLEEKNKIKEWTQMKCGEIVFDSNIHNWDMGTSEFDAKIFGRSDVVILIEDTKNNLFGGYIHAQINNYYNVRNGQWQLNNRIRDEKAFLFSLRNNGRSNEMVKMDIRNEVCDGAFLLYEKDGYRPLFGFGSCFDVGIFKKNLINECNCNPGWFAYPPGKENILTGKTGDRNPFTPKRFIVIQMK